LIEYNEANILTGVDFVVANIHLNREEAILTDSVLVNLAKGIIGFAYD
jgi:hypothetical protein